MSSTMPATNNIAQTINKLQATKTPAKKAKPQTTESEYHSGKIIVEEPEVSFDETLESSMPLLEGNNRASTSLGNGSVSTQVPESSLDSVKLMLEKLVMRLNDVDVRLAGMSSNPDVKTSEMSTNPAVETEESSHQDFQPLDEIELEGLDW